MRERVLAQHLADGLDDAGLHQLARGDVHAHRQRLVEAVLALPRGGLTARLAEHPDAERDDDARFLRERDELRGRNHFAARALPAQQRFKA